jgi:hypothetical protein
VRWREQVGRGVQLPNVSGVDAAAQVPSSQWGEALTKPLGGAGSQGRATPGLLQPS